MSRTVIGTVLRAVPRLGAAWDGLEHGISVPLIRLATTPDSPCPDGTLEAWWRISAAVRAEQERPVHPGGPCPALCLVTVLPSDVDRLGRCARALGRTLLPGTPGGPALEQAVAGTGRSPADLVAGLARLHGVLDLDPGDDGTTLHVLAGVRTDAPGVWAAYHRVATRVGWMWAA